MKRICAFLLCMVMLFQMGMVSMTASAQQADGATTVANAEPIVIYEEDFDAYTGKTEIVNGDGSGWIWQKNSDNGYAYIENGKLYFAGSAYDVLYRDGGQTWGNYTLEADFQYNTDNVNWVGLAYNVQSPTKMQKAAFYHETSNITLNGYNGKWTNNSKTLNHGVYADYGIPELTQSSKFRMKVKVQDNNAVLYFAEYDGDTLGEWIKTLEISNIPEDAQTGSIGLMSSTKTLGSAIVDNIKVYSNDYVSYTENFDNWEGKTLVSGENSDIGIFFQQYKTTTTAYISDGRLYMDASAGKSNYDQLHFLTGMNWTNYTVEADYCFVNTVGWSGLLYRTASETSSQKAGFTPSNNIAYLNGYVSKSGWANDVSGVNKGIESGLTITAGMVMRMRVVVEDNNSEMWVALYDDNGTLGEFRKIMAISNIPEDHITGSIGLMLSNGHKNVTWIDNIVVSRGKNRMVTIPERPDVADIYIPESGIVNPPVVIEQTTTKLPLASGKRPAVAIMEIDADLNILAENGDIIGNVADFNNTHGETVIPAYVVDSQTEADALAQCLNDNNTIDAFVVADSANAEFVKSVRLTCGAVRGALIFDDLSTESACKEAHRLVNNNMSYVAISRAPVGIDTATYFNLRQVSLWSTASNQAEVYGAIAAGYAGVISENVDEVYGVYESITETTVSGKPLPIAHRGAHVASSSFPDAPYLDTPENTLLSFRTAMDYGCMAVETDLRLSKDGVVVLNHDSTVDRTTDGTGAVAGFTLDELKSFTVDYMGDGEKIATFEEALAEFAPKGLVFYCHINTVDTLPEFNRLVEKYNAYDNVVVFISFANSKVYNSMTGNMVDGISYAAAEGGSDYIYVSVGDLEAVERFISELTPVNYQSLFYDYEGHMTEDFYYAMTARGFVNSHSVTNGQATLNDRLLTEIGIIGVLTDQPNNTAEYAYLVQADDFSVATGRSIDMTHNVVKNMGITEQVKCGFIQHSGPALSATDTGYAASETGDAVVSFYTTVTVPGGDAYRIYSEPVTITVLDEQDAPALADYTNVQKAIAKVPADLSSYMVSSVQAVTDAIEAVEYDLPAQEQETVDAYAQAIEDAVSKLALKAVITAVDTSKLVMKTVFPYSNPDDATYWSERLVYVENPTFYATIPATVDGKEVDVSVRWECTTEYDGTAIGETYIFRAVTCDYNWGCEAPVIEVEIVDAGWAYASVRQGFISSGFTVPYIIKGNGSGANIVCDATGCNRLMPITTISSGLETMAGVHNTVADDGGKTVPEGSQGETSVTVTGGANIDEVYGGGHGKAHTGNTNIYVNDATIKTSIHGGGYNGDVIGNANIDISGKVTISAVTGGSSHSKTVSGTAYVNIHDLEETSSVQKISRGTASKLVVNLDDTSAHLVSVITDVDTDENIKVYINGKLYGAQPIVLSDDLVNYRLRCTTAVVDGNLILTADPAGTSSMKVRLGNLPEGATLEFVETNANASMSDGIITVTNPGMKNVNVPMVITSAEGLKTDFVLVADFNNAIRYATYARLSQTGNNITVTSGAATAYVLFDTTDIDGGYVEVENVSRNLLGRYVISGSAVRFYNPVYDDGTVTVNVKNANGETVATYSVTAIFADATKYTAVLDTSLRCTYEVNGDNITVTADAGVSNVYLNFGRYYSESLSASVNNDVVKKMGARSWRVMKSDTAIEFDLYFDATAYGADTVTRHVIVNF